MGENFSAVAAEHRRERERERERQTKTEPKC